MRRTWIVAIATGLIATLAHTTWADGNRNQGISNSIGTEGSSASLDEGASSPWVEIDLENWSDIQPDLQADGSMEALLNDAGQYTIPSFIKKTIRDGKKRGVIIKQIPAAGTIVSCPQVVDLTFRYQIKDTIHTTNYSIELVDLTSPVIDILMLTNQAPSTCLDVPRYPLGTVLIPFISASSSCGVETEVLLNDHPYQVGTPITDEGLYELKVAAVGSSGMYAFEAELFEIGSRPCKTVFTVVEETTYTTNANGPDTITLTFLTAGQNIDAAEIRTGSILLLDANQEARHVENLSFSNSELYNSWYKTTITAEVPTEGTTPSEILFVGLGIQDNDLAYEWRSLVSNTPDPTPFETLANQAAISDPPDPNPIIPNDGWPGSIGADPNPDSPCWGACKCQKKRCIFSAHCRYEIEVNRSCWSGYFACAGSCEPACSNGQSGFICTARCLACEVPFTNCWTILKAVKLVRLANCEARVATCMAACLINGPPACFESDPLLECPGYTCCTLP